MPTPPDAFLGKEGAINLFRQRSAADVMDTVGGLNAEAICAEYPKAESKRRPSVGSPVRIRPIRNYLPASVGNFASFQPSMPAAMCFTLV